MTASNVSGGILSQLAAHVDCPASVVRRFWSGPEQASAFLRPRWADRRMPVERRSWSWRSGHIGGPSPLRACHSARTKYPSRLVDNLKAEMRRTLAQPYIRGATTDLLMRCDQRECSQQFLSDSIRRREGVPRPRSSPLVRPTGAAARGRPPAYSSSSSSPPALLYFFVLL
jgi:hypothetical protein